MIKATVPVVLTALLLSACGDDPDSSGKPPVLRVGQQSAPVGGAMESAAADSKMSMYYPTEWKFEVAGDLPALDDDLSAWVFRPGVEPSASDLSNLKKAFGVDGEFAKNTSDPGTEYEWTTWMVGPNDGSGPSLSVSSDAMLSWWYSEGWLTMSTPAVSCVEPAPMGEGETGSVDSSGVTVDTEVIAPCEPTEIEPPANVPSKSEAEDLFLKLADDLGYSADDLILETWADEWSAGVTGYVKIDGVRSSLIVNASFGENGRITYAGGFLAEPEKLDDYPQIGTEAGLERLREQYSGSWGPYYRGGGIAIDDIASAEVGTATGEGSAAEGTVDDTSAPVDEPTTTEPTTDAPTDSVVDSVPVDSTPVDDTVPTDDTVIIDDTVPVDETLPVETITVIIESVEQEYVYLWGVDGETYLVPGYAFIAAEDEWGYVPRYVVASIPDEYMEQVAPDMMPPIMEEPPVAEPMPAESTPIGDAPTGMITPEEADSLVGLTETEATKLAEENGWQVRIAARDGETFPLTMDYREDRVNLTIVDAVVTEVLIG